MQFYNRTEELNILNQLEEKAFSLGVMTVITGRRRVGKTALALKHAAHLPNFLYLFIGRKEEKLLCQEFVAEIKQKFKVPIIGEIKFFKDILILLKP